MLLITTEHGACWLSLSLYPNHGQLQFNVAFHTPTPPPLPPTPEKPPSGCPNFSPSWGFQCAAAKLSPSRDSLGWVAFNICLKVFAKKPLRSWGGRRQAAALSMVLVTIEAGKFRMKMSVSP